MNPTLSIEGLSFRYRDDEQWIFQNINTSVRLGDAIRVDGRNGAGKSTFLKTVSGLLEPSLGSVRGGTPLYMNQDVGAMVAPDLTVEEHLKLVRRIPESDANLLASRLVPPDTFPRKQFAGHLSGGEKQALALCCTLLAGARFLCLDEFSSSLDVQRGQVVSDCITEFLGQQKLGILFVEHRPTIAEGGTVHLRHRFLDE